MSATKENIVAAATALKASPTTITQIAGPVLLIRARPVPQAQTGSRTVNGRPSGTWPPQVTLAPLLER